MIYPSDFKSCGHRTSRGIRRVILLAAFGILTASASMASVHDLRLSDTTIEKHLSFDSQTITLTGKTDNDELVVLVSSSVESYEIIKKQRTYGIWMDGAKSRITSIPSFFHIAFSTPNGFKHYRGDSPETLCKAQNHIAGACEAFHSYKAKEGLYDNTSGTITVASDGTFSTDFDIREAAPPGLYEVIVYSVSDSGKLLKDSSLYFLVKNSETYQSIADFATAHPIEYSVIAVLLALLIGGIVSFRTNTKFRK